MKAQNRQKKKKKKIQRSIIIDTIICAYKVNGQIWKIFAMQKTGERLINYCNTQRALTNW